MHVLNETVCVICCVNSGKCELLVEEVPPPKKAKQTTVLQTHTKVEGYIKYLRNKEFASYHDMADVMVSAQDNIDLNLKAHAKRTKKVEQFFAVKKNMLSHMHKAMIEQDQMAKQLTDLARELGYTEVFKSVSDAKAIIERVNVEL
jgi:hypothetical protein